MTITGSAEGVKIPDKVWNTERGDWNGEFGWEAYAEKAEKLVIGSGITAIGEKAFCDFKNLQSIELPETLEEIRMAAFLNCENLRNISLPTSLKSIGNVAFCKSGVEIDSLPEGMETLGDYAFSGCGGIRNISLPESLTTIGRGAFSQCSNMESISLPEGITTVNDSTFAECRNLGSINLPKGVTSIGGYAFYDCGSLSSISLPEGITSIKERTFYHCNALQSVSLPESLTSIGDSAFSGCSSLNSINLSEGITSIGEYAFSSCRSLSSISLPEGITSIGKWVFYGCSSLGSISLPEGITSIGEYTFSGCSSLSSISLPEGITSIGEYAFSGCSSLSSISLPEGITSIGEKVFSYCDSLSSISLPESLTSIGEYAFYSCDRLSSINLPESLTSIGEHAFSWCKSLSSINLPESLTSIGDEAFYDCKSLSNISLPESLTSIGEYAFYNCKSLSSNSLPESLTSIGEYAFHNCKSLSGSIILPWNLQEIGYSAFGWTGIKKVVCLSEQLEIASSVFPYNAEIMYAKFTLSETSYIYDGTVKTPEVTVKVGENILVEDTDYTVTYSEGRVDAGTYEAVIELKGNYKGTITKTFTIVPKETEAAVILSETAYTYDGTEKTPTVTVTDEEGNVIDTEKYDVTYAENRVDVGEYSVKITLKGKLSGSASAVFTIVPKVLSEEAVVLTEDTCVYDGTEKAPEVIVKDGEKTLVKDTDYTVTYSEGRVDVGTYEAIVELKGNYKGTITKTFTIVPKDTAAIVTLSETEYTYDGTEKTPAVTVTDAEGNVIEAEKYDVTYEENCVDVGEYSVKITLKGKLSGTASAVFTIVPKVLSEEAVVLTEDTCVYDGTEKAPEVIAKDGEKTLVKDTDYTVTYSEGRVNIGTYEAVVELKGNYKGTITKTFTIVPKETAAVTLSQTAYTYDGTQKTPAVTVKDGEKTLVKDTDYTVAYAAGRKNVGTYKVTVQMKGNYTGKVEKTFKINPKKLTAAAVTLKTASYTYDGKQKTPTVTVKNGTTVLKKGTDYTVTYATGRTNAGTYKVTVQMKGNYTGKIEKTFKINPKKLAAAAVTLKTASYTYDGKQKTPIVTVKNGTTVLKKGTAYTVTYAAGRKNVGTYKVTVQMKGNYTGKIEKNFTINPKGTTLSTVTAQKKGFKATVKKQAAQTTGYQIQYATNSKFTGAVTKTIKNNATTSLTATNLKGGQKYFVRVRTYKTVNGKTYYSGWSVAKSVTTKK